MTYFITLKKPEIFHGKKILPTIYFPCPIVFRSWSKMRDILIDYGNSYRIRGEWNILVIIVFIVISFARLFLAFKNE